MVYFVFWMVHLVLRTVNFILLMIFYFKGWAFGCLDDVIGILDADCVICDDLKEVFYLFNSAFCYIFRYLVTSLFVFFILCFVFDDLFVFGTVYFWGPNVRIPTVHFLKLDNWAPDNWALGPICPRPNLPLFKGGQLGPGQLGPKLIWYLR